MEIEFIKDKIYCKVFDRTYTPSSGIYSRKKHNDASKLAQIQQNIDSIKAENNAKELVILNQVHGNVAICADSMDYALQPDADGSVTTKENIALGIITADCVPVLLASSDGSVIGAAHCGWKSAKQNLIHNVALMMRENGATNIRAIIGPSIQQKSYEVDLDYYNNFIYNEEDCQKLFIPSKRNGYYMFDLSGYVKYKLDQEQIELFLHINEDTYSMPQKYPSYRRSTHGIEPYNQNILSTIIIKPC
ncbi:MAG: peptidoglycan editing factor PgeF [Rickettsiaceae bacterium]|nr:peptidoglycan editing factor PgeF [Rickettsiaceae bacterium]